MLAEHYVCRMSAPVNSAVFINNAIVARQLRLKTVLPKPKEEAPWTFPHLNLHYDNLSTYLGSTELGGLADVAMIRWDAKFGNPKVRQAGKHD